MSKVFVSSTNEDLKEYRGKARDAANRAGMVPDMQEYFAAGDHPPLQQCLVKVRAADVVVAIVAHRYGWVPEEQPQGQRKSITWLECEAARAEGKEVLAFIIDESCDWPADRKEESEISEAIRRGNASAELLEKVQDNVKQLRAFKAWLSRGVRALFTTPEDLEGRIFHALEEWKKRNAPEKWEAGPARPAPRERPSEAGLGEWTLDGIRAAARKASDEYIDRMLRQRVYLPHLYARRLELEDHLRAFLSARCTKTGILVIGSSGIGKTNTMCHMVQQWRDDPDTLGPDVVLLLGASTLPAGSLSLRDVLLDRLEVQENFSRFLAALAARRGRSEAQLVIIVDGVDKHPQSRELLRQLDDLVLHYNHLPWLKVIMTLGEVPYDSIRKSGWLPATPAYYTVSVRDGMTDAESCEVIHTLMNDDELADAYHRYRQEPGLQPTCDLESLPDNVKKTLRHPLFLKIVMQIFDGRRIRNRVLTAEVLQDYYEKKVKCDRSREFLVNRIVEYLFHNRCITAPFDALSRMPELRDALLDESPRSPYLQLLEEQVLTEQMNKVRSILPPQRVVGFTYDRLLDYSLLVWIVEQLGASASTIEKITNQAVNYLPLRGALTTLLQADVDAGSHADVITLLAAGNSDVMKGVAVDLLTELEQRAPMSAQASAEELADSDVGQLTEALSRSGVPWLNALLLEFGAKLERIGLHRRAGFIYEHALRLYENAQDKSGQESMLDAIGCVHFSLGQLDVSQQFFERSLELDRELVAENPTPEARRGEAVSQLNLSEVYHRKGQLAKALELVQQARAIYDEIDDEQGLATATHLFGVLQRRHGRGGEARKCHEASLAIHKKLNDKKGVGQNLWGIGLSYLVDGLWARAFPYLQDSLQCYEELGDKAGIAYSCNALGETHRWEGSDLKKALQYYQRALDLYQEMEADRDIYMVLSNLGATHLFDGHARLASDYFDRASQVSNKIYGVDGEPETMAFMSAAALQLNDLERAMCLSDAAVAQLESLRFGEEDIQLVYWYRHQILNALDRAAEARKALRIAYDNVVQQAAAVEDPSVRAGFIENFRLRREIVDAWKQLETREAGAQD